MRREAEDTKLTLLVGGQETELLHQRPRVSEHAPVPGRTRIVGRILTAALTVVVVGALLWMLEAAAASAWITAGETERLDGTPAWPLRTMLVVFALFLTSLVAIAGARWWKRRI
jgi:hypothetical protein